MASGADVVYQATFFDGTWRGHADFLLKVAHRPAQPDSAFGPWHYEVADTKLARHVKASAILQICSYVEQLTAIQRVTPEYLHVVLGGRVRTPERLRVNDFMAYYRRVKADFEAAVGLRGPGIPGHGVPAGRDVPGARGALRRLPLGAGLPGEAAPRTTISRSLRAPAAGSGTRWWPTRVTTGAGLAVLASLRSPPLDGIERRRPASGSASRPASRSSQRSPVLRCIELLPARPGR